MFSSLKTILAVKGSSSLSQSKMCSELLCLGQLHAATVGTYNF
jgi:hypothetical protein